MHLSAALIHMRGADGIVRTSVEKGRTYKDPGKNAARKARRAKRRARFINRKKGDV